MTAQSRFPMIGYWVWLAFIVLPSAVPYLLLEWTNLVGQLFGCTPNFKMGSECPEPIQSINTWSFIAMALTIWVTFIGLPIWLVTLAVNYGRWHRANVNRNRPEARP
ncbi:hypothetical protein [Devosia sp.]|uniref:hypothetical protein n=1 Tax=Devosia sp. TaxID=1871048 RepID=UPI003A91E6AE